MRIVSLPVWGLLAGVLLHGSLWAAPPASEMRIASPWPAQNAIIAMLGYGDNIVGTSNVAKQIPLFRQSLPRIDAVPVVSVNSGQALNPEQIIALGTRLLFVPDSMKVPQLDLLERAGVRVLAFKANSMAALRERVLKTGAALGPDAQEKALAYERYFSRNVARVAERLKDLPPGQRIRVYHSMGNPLITSGRPSLNQDWMDLAGAANVAETWFGLKKEGAGEVALEQIVAANPQVIVAMNRRDAEEIRTSAQWQGIDAVLRHRVVVNPKGMFWWCRETSEEALQFLWLAKTLYPARFADIDMREETRGFYRDFFGLSLTAAQIDAILNPPA
ncbi:ABC transporter substrate-binding protein [Serratia marcescens]|jgi:iron complex transport system substrate-binding protein|uniref:ABC transporter substrate-binding protein n=1 Tax=Serratia TaxID=613 RepID=UPI0011CA1C1A|nr:MULTISPECIES: ABC transporter substrate-binding protein [Serratia]MDI6932876.1 ABC transporter substrate-binding protein [Serratia sp. Se-PFBMAAmG]MBH2761856.1 ABC transporter substrate-binding protein [Serratia marcescens]MBH2794484.1 ABC transporter substrate-binding protein [Serratia marcescens]MBH2923304.1 ABC transporter substrate-binding protein [Serratia marcescens]MBH3025895.1 ABC transporter substrate-binding protein [Serratia marcescens]